MKTQVLLCRGVNVRSDVRCVGETIPFVFEDGLTCPRCGGRATEWWLHGGTFVHRKLEGVKLQ